MREENAELRKELDSSTWRNKELLQTVEQLLAVHADSGPARTATTGAQPFFAVFCLFCFLTALQD